MFTIFLEYTTGDTFHTEETSTTLEAEWTLDVAKENLKRIKEHYKAYQDRNGYASCMMGKRENDLLEKIKNERWFIQQKVGSWTLGWEHSVRLLENDGSTNDYSCDWCGYFETLHGGRIVGCKPNGDDNDLEFSV